MIITSRSHVFKSLSKEFNEEFQVRSAFVSLDERRGLRDGTTRTMRVYSTHHVISSAVKTLPAGPSTAIWILWGKNNMDGLYVDWCNMGGL